MFGGVDEAPLRVRRREDVGAILGDHAGNGV